MVLRQIRGTGLPLREIGGHGLIRGLVTNDYLSKLSSHEGDIRGIILLPKLESNVTHLYSNKHGAVPRPSSHQEFTRILFLFFVCK